jgi:hypothetical protein
MRLLSALLTLAVAAIAPALLPSALARQDGTDPPDLSGIMVAEAPAAANAYIVGLATGDASLMWDAYSNQARQQGESSGMSRESTQGMLDQAIRSGTRLIRATYIGSYPLDGGSMHFYVVVRTQASGPDATAPFVFTLDSDGKIDRID